jgi:uncharacterized protein with NAD-binding domain and iron-sulfur cluster
MHETVAIVGGGVAGLSAAHELVERGFKVHVYERRSFLGGKAASYRVPQGRAAAPAANDPPGEHGFRFFPGWYRHLTDTMCRIPYYAAGGGRRTVADNLVSVKRNLLAWFDRPSIELPLRAPRSVNDTVSVVQFLSEFSSLGITTSEVALFMRKVVELLILPDEKRVEVYESQSWWDYLECSKPGRSRAYQDLARATTRTMVAAKAEQVSAYTIGRLGIRTLLDTLSTLDRVLNGPSSEVWIDPWVAYLESRGVEFHKETELRSIVFNRDSRRVQHLVVQSISTSHVRRLRKRVCETTYGAAEDFRGKELAEAARDVAHTTADPACESIALELEQRSTRLGDECGTHIQRTKARRDAIARGEATDDDAYARAEEDFHASWNTYRTHLAEVEASLAQVEARDVPSVADADYFVLALPLEQLAYYVNRTTMLTFLAPELQSVIPLCSELDWMAGIQFYLTKPLDLAPGHLVGLDSDWGLTAIEQTQFWEDVRLPANVRAVLSVDIAAWNKKGRKVRKAAFNCTLHEIAEEVWAQLGELLNKKNRHPILRDDMLIGGRLKKNESYHLDDTIVERYDRKKQAAYERARGVSFGTLVDSRGELTPEEKSADHYMWGQRRLFNAEPLLINRAGTRKLRPSACTSLPNLFLAADYVKTETDLACMEGANEAARLAVNGILKVTNSPEPPCVLWPFSPSRHAIESVAALAAPAQAVRNLTNVVARLQDRIFKGFGSGQ